MAWRNYDAMSEAKPLAESRLWQAVIVSTIEEWLSGPLLLKRQAEEYLFKDDSDFPAVCQSAGMDVGRLRSKLTHLRMQSATASPAMPTFIKAPPQPALQPARRPTMQPARRSTVAPAAQSAAQHPSPAL
jgi:hypothetical protein